MSLVILGLGDFAFWRRLLTVLLTESACSVHVSSGLIADSTLQISQWLGYLLELLH